MYLLCLVMFIAIILGYGFLKQKGPHPDQIKKKKSAPRRYSTKSITDTDDSDDDGIIWTAVDLYDELDS